MNIELPILTNSKTLNPGDELLLHRPTNYEPPLKMNPEKVAKQSPAKKPRSNRPHFFLQNFYDENNVR